MKVWTAALYLLARWEVSYALARDRITGGNHCEDDLLPSHLIPSCALGNYRDRVLAEIDQDGFLFAIERRDAHFFNTRQTMAPRKDHRVQIVLTGGAVRIRKAVLHNERTGIFARIFEVVQWELYLEAAALLRLRGLACVPTIRRIDPAQGVIEMDYIWGRDLRQVFSDGRCEIDYEHVFSTFSAVIARPDSEISRQVAELLSSVIGSGVVPRDVHAANLIRAGRSGRLYLIDFSLVYLRPVPGWRSHARNLAWLFGESPGVSEIQKTHDER